MKGYVKWRADEGFGSVSDYIRDLIRNDQKKYIENMDAADRRQAVQPRQTASASEKIPVDEEGYLDVSELLRY